MSEDYAARRDAAPEPVPDTGGMPAPARPFTIAAPEQQISIGVADTPAGPRLAVIVTILLDPAAGKGLAEGFGRAAASMSTQGLAVANGTVLKT